MRQKLSLEEATILALQGKLQEDSHEDKNIESELDSKYEELLNGILDEFPDAETKERDWSNQGYKHRIDIITPSINIKEGTSRCILIDIFYNVPHIPTYSYYLGATAEIVETSSDETFVAGMKSNGYEVKNEIKNCKISIEGYAGDKLKDKGNSIEDFVKTVSEAYFNLRNYNMKRFM